MNKYHTYSRVGVTSSCFVQYFNQEIEIGALQKYQVFIRYSILVLVNETLSFVLNIQSIVSNCECIVGETRLFEVVFEVWTFEIGVQFLHKALI